MDAPRYARVRELFLASEELPADQRCRFVHEQSAGDTELEAEVLSLLDEHNAEAAQCEGENVQASMPLAFSNRTDPAAWESPFPRPQSSESARSYSDADVASLSSSAASSTQLGAQRTHAEPRVPLEQPAPLDLKARSQVLAGKPSHNRRLDAGWLWIAMMLPTALVGWLTYRQVVAAQRQSVQRELDAIADTLAAAADQFLSNQQQLVMSWSRDSVVRQAILELVEISDQVDAQSALRSAPQTDVLRNRLRVLAGTDEVKFVAWNDDGFTITSWLDDRADVGNRIANSALVDHWRVFEGTSLLFGPARLRDNTKGFVPETDQPVMAPLVPIFSDDGQVKASLLVRGLHAYPNFDAMFRNAAAVDAYAIDDRGVMVTASPHAGELADQDRLQIRAEELAATMRVADPGEGWNDHPTGELNREALPLTFAASGATAFQDGNRLKPYRNYAGEEVVGVWRGLPEWRLGVIVEQNAKSAFAVAGLVGFGFAGLSALLSATVLLAAQRLYRRSQSESSTADPLCRYQIVEELGTGGMGIVYRARHRHLGREAAIKVLRAERRFAEDRLRFDREARLAASLTNPHNVTIYDYGARDNGEVFCVMEFLRGLTLYEVVARSGFQPIGRVLFVMQQVCEAIREAHGLGLMHRDLKPQNVMLTLDSSVGDWAVVFDFGLAKPLEPAEDLFQTSETVWAGTPMYMAPERYRSPAISDPRSDIYSIGCIAYFLLAGRPPFAECDPESMFALILNEDPIRIGTHRGEDLPQRLIELVDRCMAKHVDQRIETIEEVSRIIDDLRSGYSWTLDDAKTWWEVHGPS